MYIIVYAELHCLETSDDDAATKTLSHASDNFIFPGFVQYTLHCSAKYLSVVHNSGWAKKLHHFIIAMQ